MNPVHDAHVHTKRTSINELLNPVGAPASSLEPAYNQQLPSLAAALQYPPHHHAQAPAQYPQQLPPQMNNGPQYSLRAANWESQKEELAAARRSEVENASCRYPPQGSMPPHPMYADSYARRPTDEAPSHYSMDGAQSWPSSHEPPNASYAAQMMPPVYPDERAGELLLVAPITSIAPPNPIHSAAAPSGEGMPRSEFLPCY